MRSPLLLASLLILGAASVASSQPEPEWAVAQRTTEEAIDRSILRLQDENTATTRDYADILRQMKAAARTGADAVRLTAARETQFFVLHDVPGRDRGDLIAESQALLAAKLQFIYGWIEPEYLFNESYRRVLVDNPTLRLAMPEYPIPFRAADAQYCSRYDARAVELADLIRSIDPDYLPKDSGKNVCVRGVFAP